MRAIRVNADYEMMLFENKSGPSIINQSLEFLAFFLTDRPVYTSKKYSAEYLDHVESITQRKPEIQQDGPFENWWGSLSDIGLERRLNSKLESALLSPDTQIVSKLEEIKILSDKIYVAKAPGGMSGQHIRTFTRETLKNLEGDLLGGPLVIEPLFERIKDFSHYIFPDGMIAYENIVDRRFQYRGTIQNLLNPTQQGLSFYTDADSAEWERFSSDLNRIKEHYFSLGAKGGFSIDSFLYLEDNVRRIRSLSEVNYRKTMGLMSWELSKKYLVDQGWSFLCLVRKKKAVSFQQIKSACEKTNVLYLSPGDTRFEIFLIGSSSAHEGLIRYEELKSLLPDCEFPI
jgi:hypothetical protein